MSVIKNYNQDNPFYEYIESFDILASSTENLIRLDREDGKIA